MFVLQFLCLRICLSNYCALDTRDQQRDTSQMSFDCQLFGRTVRNLAAKVEQRHRRSSPRMPSPPLHPGLRFDLAIYKTRGAAFYSKVHEIFVYTCTYTARWDLGIAFGTCIKGERHCRLESGAPAAGIHQPCHSDTEGVKGYHWGREKTHVQDVGSGCNDCRNDENGENRVSEIPQHPAGRNHSH